MDRNRKECGTTAPDENDSSPVTASVPLSFDINGTPETQKDESGTIPESYVVPQRIPSVEIQFDERNASAVLRENAASTGRNVDTRIPTTIMVEKTDSENDDGIPNNLIAREVALLISPTSPTQHLNELTEQSFSLGKIMSASTATTNTTQSSGTHSLGSTKEMVLPSGMAASTRNNSIKDEVPVHMLQLSEEDPDIVNLGCVSPFNTGDGGSKADETSIMSVQYFDLSDFSPMDWAATLTEHEVMVGLAVVYIAVGLTHPLLFLAGALTAAGTATTIGAGYDYIIEPLCLCQNEAAAAPPPADTVEASTDQTNREQTPLLMDAVPKREEVSSPSNVSIDESFSTVAITNKRSHIPPHLPNVNTAGSTLKAMSTLVEGLPENWVESHYPKLEQVVVESNELLGLNVKQFFQVFLSDCAPYNFLEFQKHRGDKNINYGKWKKMGVDNTSSFSMHPTADTLADLECDCHDYLTRTLSFQAKTNNTFFGPPYASTTKEQRLLILNKKLGILEVRTTLADIPFCDRFFVMERWIISAEKNDEGVYQCHYSVSMQVFFSKSCPFESQIRTKTYSSLCDVCKAWSHMAQQALLLSEQHKQERIRQEQIEERSIDSSVAGIEDEKKEEETTAPVSPKCSTKDAPCCEEIEILAHDSCQASVVSDQNLEPHQIFVVANLDSAGTSGIKSKKTASAPNLLRRTISLGRRSRNSSNNLVQEAGDQSLSQDLPCETNRVERPSSFSNRFARAFSKRTSQSESDGLLFSD